MTRENAMKYIKQQSPDAFLPKARKIGFVCPRCGNGTGSSGDGIVKNPRDGRYHCFKCGEVCGDIFDLIGAAFDIPDFNSQFNKAAEIYNVSVDKFGGASSLREIHEPAAAVNETARKGDVSEYLEKCRNNVKNTSFFADRGISEKTVERFGLGYDPEFSEGTGGRVWRAAVFPLSKDSFEVRNTDVPPDSGARSGDKYRKHGRAGIFNLSPEMLADSTPLFVCEGIMDALSIIECGFRAAALGSAANYRLLSDAVDKYGVSCPLVLLFDPDEAGKNALEKLSLALSEKNADFYDGSEILGNYHDPNARLIKDSDGLKAALSAFEERIASLSGDMSSWEENELFGVNAGCCLSDFREHIERGSLFSASGTGFSGLDSALNGGLYPGLYIFGAVSSLGKTTLLLQIADNIAASGRDVLFFSLEQSRFELMSKSISRETLLFCRENRISVSNAKDNIQIADGSRWAEFDEMGQYVVNGAFEKYGKYAPHLFIFEGQGNISVSDIGGYLRKYLSFGKRSGLSPVIIVDYLQILKPQSDRISDKQAVDRNITALKQLSRDHDIPLLAVSSLNRTSYGKDVTMDAFKESGSIEYGADVLVGLQFEGAGENNFDMAAARSRSPRHIELCILKNRNGRIPPRPLEFKYYPQFNCFEEA